jgi:hypothetical protein
MTSVLLQGVQRRQQLPPFRVPGIGGDVPGVEGVGGVDQDAAVPAPMVPKVMTIPSGFDDDRHH